MKRKYDSIDPKVQKLINESKIDFDSESAGMRDTQEYKNNFAIYKEDNWELMKQSIFYYHAADMGMKRLQEIRNLGGKPSAYLSMLEDQSSKHKGKDKYSIMAEIYGNSMNHCQLMKNEKQRKNVRRNSRKKTKGKSKRNNKI